MVWAIQGSSNRRAAPMRGPFTDLADALRCIAVSCSGILKRNASDARSRPDGHKPHPAFQRLLRADPAHVTTKKQGGAGCEFLPERVTRHVRSINIGSMSGLLQWLIANIHCSFHPDCGSRSVNCAQLSGKSRKMRANRHQSHAPYVARGLGFRCKYRPKSDVFGAAQPVFGHFLVQRPARQA